MIVSPSTSGPPGASREDTMCRFALGQTVSHHSALMDRGGECEPEWGGESAKGPPAVGPDMNALRGTRLGRRAKSYIVHGNGVWDHV